MNWLTNVLIVVSLFVLVFFAYSINKAAKDIPDLELPSVGTEIFE